MKTITMNYEEICKNNPTEAYNIDPEMFYKYVLENICSTLTEQEVKEIISNKLKEN